MQYVYVLHKHGEPLMPCSPGKARLLLKQQKACVVKRTPFTIKLLYGSVGYKQPITLGVDAGSKHVGLSASTEKRELYSEEFTPRNDVVELLSTRRQNRRSRRNRKTRYRAPRFDNRVHSKHNRLACAFGRGENSRTYYCYQAHLPNFAYHACEGRNRRIRHTAFESNACRETASCRN